MLSFCWAAELSRGYEIRFSAFEKQNSNCRAKAGPSGVLIDGYVPVGFSLLRGRNDSPYVCAGGSGHSQRDSEWRTKS